MASNSQVVASLKASIKELEAQRDAEMEAVRKRFHIQIGSIENTISVLNGGKPVVLDPHLDQADVHMLSISDERLAMIRKYVLNHPQGVRQAEIGPSLKINSGSVSVGLRRLSMAGEIEPGGVENGSRLWLPLRVTAPAAA